MAVKSISLKNSDNYKLNFITLLLLIIVSSLVCESEASEIRGKPYAGEFHFVEIRRKRHNAKKIPRVVVLPVVSSKKRKKFENKAFEQISDFFSNYNFVIPSYIEIDNFLSQNEISPDDYPNNFDKIAKKFEAKYVVFLNINRISRLKKINAAGTIVAGVTISGVGRYAAGEYVLKVYSKKNKQTQTFSAVERRKDHILGLFQSAERLAFKLQTETLHSLLDDFAQNKIKRSEGYILAPLKTYFPDAKGFQ
ncbi:MAG: hypothetical protein VX619_01350 [bacterium]|nr:hypothetical protein [bacterium]